MATGRNATISIGGRVIVPWFQAESDLDFDFAVIEMVQSWPMGDANRFLVFMDQITKLRLHK